MVVPPTSRADILKSFVGCRAHDYEWLRASYLTNQGVRFPREITKHFTLVNYWSTDLRYMPHTMRTSEATAFLASTLAIVRWADGRL